METPSYYAVIPASVRYANIPPSAKLLYGEITALASKSGICWASNQYFAELYGVAPTTVSEWMRCLYQAGFIKISVDKDAGNKRQVVLATPIQENPKTSSGKAEDPSSGKAEDNNTRVNTKSNIPPNPQGGSERFAEFWDAYPPVRKKDKPQCEVVWKRKRLDAKADEVMAGLHAWKSSHEWQKEGGKYTKGPLPWLRGEYWTTAPEAKKTYNYEDLPF